MHQRADIRARIAAAGGAISFLPASSPDFNPIEQASSKLEAAIADALATITSTDARHWFSHDGYDLAGRPL